MSHRLEDVAPDVGFYMIIVARIFNAQEMKLVDNLAYEEYHRVDDKLWFMKGDKDDAKSKKARG